MKKKNQKARVQWIPINGFSGFILGALPVAIVNALLMSSIGFIPELLIPILLGIGFFGLIGVVFALKYTNSIARYPESNTRGYVVAILVYYLLWLILIVSMISLKGRII